MRFRNSSGQLIMKRCIYRQGSLPYSSKFININYQEIDTTLAGLCPCDYPLDIYVWRDGNPAYLEKWRSNDDENFTFLLSSDALEQTSNNLVPTKAFIGPTENVYLQYLDSASAPHYYAIDGLTGNTLYHLERADFGIGVSEADPQIISPVSSGLRGGCYAWSEDIDTDDQTLYRIDTLGAINSRTNADINVFSPYGSNGFRDRVHAHPSGFLALGDDSEYRFYNHNLALVGTVPSDVHGGTGDPLISDQDGSIYCYGKCDITLALQAWDISPKRAFMAWPNDAGIAPETDDGLIPFIMAVDETVVGADPVYLYDQGPNILWQWGGNTGFGPPAQTYHNADSVLAQHDIVGGNSNVGFTRFNDRGTQISTAVSAPPGTLMLLAAGCEACLL